MLNKDKILRPRQELLSQDRGQGPEAKNKAEIKHKLTNKKYQMMTDNNNIDNSRRSLALMKCFYIDCHHKSID